MFTKSKCLPHCFLKEINYFIIVCQKQVALIRFTKIYCQNYINFTPGQDADGHERASLTSNKKKYKSK